jgi:hypothetical protein
MKTRNKVSLWLAVLGLAALNSPAQVVLGSFQSSSDPTDAGWSDWSSGIGITAAAPGTDTQYSFVAAGVPGYAQSLQITPANPGYSQNLSISLSASQRAAFLTNSYLTFTFSVPAASPGETGGYSQIGQIVINAPGWGFNGESWANASAIGNTGNNQSGEPNFYFGSGSPLQSQTVTLLYTNAVAAMGANPGYINIIFITGSGGGAPASFYINNVELSTQPFGLDTAPGVTLLGGFQNASDPTDAGWEDWSESGNPAITAAAPPGGDVFSFVSAGVPGYANSLEVTPSNPGYSQNLALNFSQSQIAAFLTNSWLTFTFSVPGPNTTSSGYSQIYQVILNAPGWGFNQLPWSLSPTGEPQFDFGFGGSTPQTQQVTLNYSSVLSAIGSNPGYMQLIFLSQSGGGAPPQYYMNNVVLSSGPNGTEAAGPGPRLGIQKATPELRIFAGSTVNWYDRAELDAVDQNQSWIWTGASYPVTYSFKLLDFPVAPQLQCQLDLIPINSLGSGDYPTHDEFVDYQAGNELWVQIIGAPANPNGSAGYYVQVGWKTNSPNTNPTNLALLNGGGVVNGIYTNTGNQSPVGTWTLTFTGPTNGTLTPPGVAPLAFAITDTNAVSDFANPVLAVFGLQSYGPAPTSGTPNEGTYIDYASISVNGVMDGNYSEDFTKEAAGNTITTSGLWDTSDSAIPASVQLVTSATPLWFNWTLPAIGYALGEATQVPVTAAPGNQGGWVLPTGFSGNSVQPAPVNQGGTNWLLFPAACLPTNANSVWTLGTNVFFQLVNPAPPN